MQIEHQLDYVAVFMLFAVCVITDVDTLFCIVGAVGFGDKEELGALVGKHVGIADAEKQVRVFGGVKIDAVLDGRVAVYRSTVQLSVGDLD